MKKITATAAQKLLDRELERELLKCALIRERE